MEIPECFIIIFTVLINTRVLNHAENEITTKATGLGPGIAFNMT